MLRLLHTLGEIFRAVLKGELLLRWHFDRYFLHITWLAFLVLMYIILGIKVQDAMVQVEKNEDRIEELKVYRAQKSIELARFGRMTIIEDMLGGTGSDVSMPDKPAARIN